MGIVTSNISKIISSFSTVKRAKISIIGLDNAGKTAILYFLQSKEMPNTIPTIGFNVEEIQIANVAVQCFDIGGQARIRDLWTGYVKGADGIVFVVDILDEERFKEAADILKLTADVVSDKSTPFLILANKMDVPKDQSFQDKFNKFVSTLELKNGLGNNSKYQIFQTSVVEDPNNNPNPFDTLHKAFLWLVNEVK